MRKATKHAEIIAIDEIRGNVSQTNETNMATQFKASKLLTGATLYVTVEPCIMCAWILRILSIEKVYYGASNPRFGGNGSVLGLHCKLLPKTTGDNILEESLLNQSYECIPGLLEEEAIAILKDFYGNENTNGMVQFFSFNVETSHHCSEAPPEKRKKKVNKRNC